MSNQPKTTKVIGITATPERTNDENLNMANEWARYFGYTEKDIELHKHLAINLDIEEAIKLGYVVNPKVVFCEYNLFEPGGVLYNLHERINMIQDESVRNRSLEEFNRLRKIVEKSHGISQIIGDNLKLGDRCLVFLPVVNKDGKEIEDEDGNIVDYRIYGDEVIEKYKNLLISYLQEYYHLSKDEISDIVEFHSMLGKYGKGKNQYELEKFEQKDDGKIKFMLVLNKGNEGMHVKCEAEINLRPTESSILILQQLGRVEYGILPNQIIPDEDRPTVIDLVGNLFVYTLNKEKNKVDDLDKLKIVIDWINNNGIIPSINTTDKVEYMHAITLRSIKNKYIKYLTIEDKDKITTKIQEIIRLGSMIDLWYIEYPEVVISKDGSKRIINEDDTFFELTGVLQDFCELSKEVDSNLYMSFEEKKQELIKTIHELHRLPKNSRHNEGQSERKFKDDTDQRNFYDRLKQDIKKIQEKLNIGIEITKEELKKLEAYDEINRVLSQYVIEVPFKEKVKELINSIHELHRLPKQQGNNSGQSEKLFIDGKDQRRFYNNLKQFINKIQEKINRGIVLTKEEQQKLDAYDEINRVLSQYVMEVPFEEKIKELINSIHELHRLPKQQGYNSGQSEKEFRDGTDQRNFYDKLKQDIKKIQEKLNNGIELIEEEQQKLDAYDEMNRVLSQYIMEVSLEEKVQELIKSIQELHRLPKHLVHNSGQSGKEFRDGTYQRNFYDKLKQDIKKIQEKLNNGIELIEEEQQKLDAYDEINRVLSQYVMEVSLEEKVQELIKSIQELHRLPKHLVHNSGQSEKEFRDGTDQRNFYDKLKRDIKKIQEKLNNGIELIEEEQQKLNAYDEINRVLSQYVMEVSLEEKVQELIKSIHELNRLPKKSDHNSGQLEKKFIDGSDQRSFYDHLKQDAKKIQEKINNGIKLTEDEQQKKNAFEEIEKVLSFYPKTKTSNKNMIIELCNQYGIDTKINKSILDKSYYEVYTKLMYLIDNNIPIIDNNGTLCNIFYMADINMQLKYGVSIDKLVDRYIINGKRL